MDRISGSMQNTINEIWSKFLNAGGICVRQKSGFSNLFARQYSAEVAFLVLFPIISLSFFYFGILYVECMLAVVCILNVLRVFVVVQPLLCVLISLKFFFHIIL